MLSFHLELANEDTRTNNNPYSVTMFDPFQDYFGLSGLLSNCKLNGDFKNSSHLHTDDFNSNGVDVPVTNPAMGDLNNNVVSNASTAGFLPLNVDITELSKVMRGAGRRPNGRSLGTAARPPSWCVFCKNNGESELVYASHKLKSEDGITTCPILRAYTCPLCGTNGDRAHTIKYCPVNKAKEDVGPGTIGQTSQYRTPRTSTGRRRTSSISNASTSGFN
ncbi:protein nanos-like [Lytechinus variegatus]|uniref:protein nanos-like n=1 Tax=Lytechinus variegatus TaxID=7654 RepID=UPI001BB2C614|nr:protein nanos-like [Lytechinus variegatus]